MKPRIVVGYDRSPSSERALLQAGREAAWRTASVEVVHAFHRISTVEPLTHVPVRAEESPEDAAAELADIGADLLRHRHPGMTVRAEAAAGPPAEILTGLAHGADLLVVGSRGRGGFPGLTLGSVSTQTVGRSPCPVMVVRGVAEDDRGAVVAAIDVEDVGGDLLDFTFAEASRRAVPLKAMSAWDLSGPRRRHGGDAAARHVIRLMLTAMEQVLQVLVEPWERKYPDVRVDCEVADGSPAAVLSEASRHADLIVAGAHRRGGDREGVRVGPITQTLLRHADCPVVVVPWNRDSDGRGDGHDVR